MPTIHDFEKILNAMAITGDLPRRQKSDVREFLKAMCPEPTELAALRHKVVTVAASRLAGHQAAEVLLWSHELQKLLLPNVPDGLPEVECHFSPSESGRTRLCELIGNARETIDLCMYLLADDELARALIAAHRDHGVVVRIILDDQQLKLPGSDHDMLEAAGIPYRTDSCAQYMHHKFGIYDRTWISTGSANWTRKAAEANFENMIMTNDPRVAGPFVREFERLWKDFR
jgi:cardiolipin hydrolase